MIFTFQDKFILYKVLYDGIPGSTVAADYDHLRSTKEKKS